MKIKSVKFNFIMNFILTASSIIFPLITFPYVSRILLVEGNGHVSFASSVMTYFAMFASLGIPTYGIRVCAQVRDNRRELSKTVQELIIINLFTTVIVFAVFIISLFYVPKFEQQKSLLLINSVSLWLNVIGVDWLYSALEQYTYITMRSLLFKVISIILMFLLVRQRSDYVIYGAISVFAAAGSNILNFINLRKYVTFKRQGPYDFVQHIRPIFVFFATSAATSVYTNLDTILLGFISGDTAVGLYNAAIKVKLVLVSLVTSLGTVLLPRLSYYIGKGLMEEFKDTVKGAFNFILIFASFIVLYFEIYAKDVILVLSGRGFIGAVLPMQIVMPAVFFIGLTNIMGIQILVPMGKERLVLFSIICGAAADAVANLLLIPKMAETGTAVATAIAELVVCLVQLYFLKDLVFSIIRQLSIRKVVVALCVAAAVALSLRYVMPWRPIICLIVSSILTFIAYLGTLLLQREAFLCHNIKPIVLKILGRLRVKS